MHNSALLVMSSRELIVDTETNQFHGAEFFCVRERRFAILKAHGLS
jgi:hypothetical protein